MMDHQFTSLESCVQHWRQHWTIPGIVVGIYRDGDVTLHAEGISNLNTGWPMRADNLFRIASITKMFTATAAMMLVDEGKLDLDAPIQSYIPDLELADPEAKNTITMRHLLSHASGLYGDVFDDYGLGNDSLERFVGEFREIRQLTKPGELWHYCNSGFDLAGMVIAQVSGRCYEDVIRGRIFEPLGMKRSGFFAHEMIAYPHAVGHEPVEPLSEEHRVSDQSYPRNNNPSGAVITNAEELLRFAELHLYDGSFRGRQLLSVQSARSMREPQIESGDFADHWGIGWDIRQFGNGTLYGHGGSTNGFQSQLTILPDKKFALCIWANSGRGRQAIRPIEEWILQQEFGLVRTNPEPVELRVAQFERVSGRYNNPLGEVDISVENGALRVRMRSLREGSDEMVELPDAIARPLSPDRFMVLDGIYKGEVLNFFPRGAERPAFLRRHGRLFDRST
jgi:CubicO group peptidase (beta-lactamase class C family)